MTNETYQTTGKGLSRADIQGMPIELKKQAETEWLKEPDSQCLQVVALNLSKGSSRKDLVTFNEENRLDRQSQ